MNSRLRSGLPGLAYSALLFAALSASPAFAQDAASASEVTVNEAVLDLYIETRTQQPASAVAPADREALRSELVDLYLLSEQPQAETLAQNPRVQAQLELQERGILANIVASDFLMKNQATEQEILDEYARQIELAPQFDFKARHILVPTQALATEIIAELEAGGDFQELAREHSTDSSADQGGDLGWFSPDRMVQPFSQAVSALEDGAYTTEPVQTQFGWHVILREDSRNSEPPTLESVRDVLKQSIEQNRLRSYIQ
ncbi:MAG: peptidylprolyl isomerase, partial [Woeseiaceae bacterium]|nr:peptidylprolyl isomerase [Woeseiaceae bacterium]